jgi:hypothetical protein
MSHRAHVLLRRDSRLRPYMDWSYIPIVGRCAGMGHFGTFWDIGWRKARTKIGIRKPGKRPGRCPVWLVWRMGENAVSRFAIVA